MGFISNYLNNQIKSKQANINKINDEIDRYVKAQDDALNAQDGFIEALNIIQDVVGSIRGILEGETGDAFRYMLENYRDDLKLRVNDMTSVCKECKKRISSLEKAKKDALKSVEKLKDLLNYVNKINIFNL